MDSWDGTNSMNVLKEAEQRGYERAIDELLEWNEKWEKQHDKPFNWYGAAKALKSTQEAKQERLRDGTISKKDSTNG